MPVLCMLEKNKLTMYVTSSGCKPVLTAKSLQMKYHTDKRNPAVTFITTAPVQHIYMYMYENKT